MLKLAIVGSRQYTNQNRIKAIVEKYINQYGDLTIISGGCPQGADLFGKQIALELGLPYKEYAPIHAKYNQYCVLKPENYNKSYNVGNFFQRNSEIAKNCDHLLAFVVKGLKCSGTMDTYTKAKNLNKQVFMFED